MGKSRTFYTESGFNIVPRAFPPLPFFKKNVLEMRLGVIVVEVSFMCRCMKSISFLQ